MLAFVCIVRLAQGAFPCAAVPCHRARSTHALGGCASICVMCNCNRQCCAFAPSRATLQVYMYASSDPTSFSTWPQQLFSATAIQQDHSAIPRRLARTLERGGTARRARRAHDAGARQESPTFSPPFTPRTRTSPTPKKIIGEAFAQEASLMTASSRASFWCVVRPP